MLGLPKSTEFNKRIPKSKFYENLQISPELKRCFAEQIKVIYWRNKLSPDTINLSAGSKVQELQVFSIRLNGPELDEAVLRQIDREISYHIVFILEYDGQCQAWIGYKEQTGPGSSTAFKVTAYYHTDWMPEADLPLHLEGLDLDAVYENFVRQVAGDQLQQARSEENLDAAVKRAQQAEKLQKKIAALETKIRRERQLNRQMELRAELRQLQKELEGMQ